MHQLLTQRHRLARPFSPRQPISGHPGRLRYHAAKEDDLVPGQGAFLTRDELVDGNFSTAQAECLSKLFPSGSALAKVFEAQELKEKEEKKIQELKEKEKAQLIKEEKKIQELKEKEKAQEIKEEKKELNKSLEEVKKRLDNLSLALGIVLLVLLVQNQGTVGVISAIFKSVFRL